jgi:hypothetical protein
MDWQAAIASAAYCKSDPSNRRGPNLFTYIVSHFIARGSLENSQRSRRLNFLLKYTMLRMSLDAIAPPQTPL